MGAVIILNMLNALSLALILPAVCASVTTISVFYDSTSHAYTHRPGLLPGATATASFDDSANQTGWAKLNVHATSPDDAAYYAAGMAEGLLTCESVVVVNSNNDDTDHSNQGVINYAKTTLLWTRAQVAKNPGSEYWRAMGQLLAQFDGLVDGYNRSACSAAMPLSELDHFLMQMDGDLEDLNVKFQTVGTQPPNASSRPQHCSSLVKLTDDHSDIFFGHATWDTYSNMAPRIFKTYALPVVRNGTLFAHVMHFSSTGSWLSSVDDFYTISGSAELAVIETSNTVLNISLYKDVVPESLLSWLRAVVANRLASDGADWARLFQTHHSGTYTNQWQVIDMSKFKPNPTAGLLTVLEEVPGLVVSKDMTAHLMEHKYWPSYNVPFFDAIRARNGDPANSWTTAPRAKLFQMLQPNVTSLSTMQHVMRWNEYTKYPGITGDNPCSAIACRADLRSPGTHPQSAFGAIDAKVSSYSSLFPSNGNNSLIVYANAGPTHDDQPVFCWSAHPFEERHQNHPDCFEFGWDEIGPTI